MAYHGQCLPEKAAQHKHAEHWTAQRSQYLCSHLSDTLRGVNVVCQFQIPHLDTHLGT